MSTTIDNRVVEMQFDNKQFERNVATSMSTLEKLKRSLNFTGSAKSLEGLNSSVRGIDMGYLGNAVESVGMKFNALGVMGVTALTNLTNSAVNAGKRIVSALTIDPIKTGFQEYETKMGAIQTILSNTSSKGTTIDDVTRTLNKLNTYADKTIYNFAEMTRNIGTFTAAGIGLDDSASAIQGIANLAAASGSTSQQASTAMYQLSQALSTGTVRLMDWNSVVNAGMGGEKFQEALKATAREYGVGVDAIIEKNGSFRDSLQEGWLSAEILNTTLKKFTVEGADEYGQSMIKAGKWTEGEAQALIDMAQEMEDAATKVKTFTQLWDTLKESAQSGWAQTWEIMVGDFEEARETLTKFSDVIGGMLNESANARNAVLSGGLTSGWKQLLNAGIHDGEGFKAVLGEVAKEAYNIDLSEALSDVEKFQEVLKSGKLTPDLLTDSLSRFTEKVSAMSDEEIKAAGYTEDQIKTLKKLNTEVQNGTVSMEEFAKRMARPSGRENLIESVWNVFNGLLSVINPIKEAFREIFPATTAEQVYALTESIRTFTERLTLSESATKNLKSTFKGIFAIFDILKQALVATLTAIAPLFGGLDELGGGILGVTAGWGEWLVALNDSIRSSDIFGKAARKVADFITNIKWYVLTAAEAVKSFFSHLSDKIEFPGLELLSNLADKIKERFTMLARAVGLAKDELTTAMGEAGSAIEKPATNFMTLMTGVWKLVKGVGSAIVNAFNALGRGLANAIGDINYEGIFDLINTLSFSGIAVYIGKFVNSVSEVADVAGSFKESVIGILDEVKGCFEAYQSQLKAETLLKIASAIGILAASILVISLIDSEKLSASLGAITVLFADLMGSLQLFTKMSGNLGGVAKAITAMLGISVSVFILAGALKMISDMDLVEMTTGLIGITALTAIVIAAAKALSSSGKDVVKGAGQMVIFAIAIKILAGVCKDLSELSFTDMVQGLAGVAGLMGAVLLFLNNAKFSGKSVSTATGILILSAAIKVLASACRDLGTMTLIEVSQGLLAIGTLLGTLALFTKFTSGASSMVFIGIGMIAIGAAMKIFASAIRDLSGLSFTELGIGLSGLISALLAVTIALNYMPKNMISSGIGMVAIAGALVILAEALTVMGKMSIGSVAISLIALGGSMAILAVGLKAMNGTLAGSAALLVAAAALRVFTPVLTTLGNMSLGEIIKSLVALAAAFTVIGVASALLQPVIPAMLGLGASMALIGVGVLAVAAGLSLLAAAFTTLATVGAAGATAIVAALTVIIMGIASLIPAVIVKLGEAIVAFCGVIISAMPAIAGAFKVLVLSLLDVLVTLTPAIIEGALFLLVSLLQAIEKYTPQIIETLFKILIAALQGIADNIGQVIETAVDVVLAFIEGITKKIPDVIQAGFDLLLSFINGITDAINTNTPLLVEAFQDLILAILNAGITVITGNIELFKKAGDLIMNSGLVKGIRDKVSAFKKAVSELVEKGRKAIEDKVGEWKTAGAELLTKCIEGISGKLTNIKKAATDLIDAAKKAITEKVSEWTTAGGDIVDGLVSGIKTAASNVVEAAKGVVSSALEGAKKLLGINSPSKAFAEIGRYSDEGLVVGLKAYAGRVVTAAKDVGSGAIDAMSGAISKASTRVFDNIDSQPTIRPVLDLSDVRAGAGMIDGMFGMTPAVGVLANVGAIDSMMNRNRQNGNNDDIVSAINKLRGDLSNVGGTQYNINGVTYDDGSNIHDAVKSIVRAVKIGGRV